MSHFEDEILKILPLLGTSAGDQNPNTKFLCLDFSCFCNLKKEETAWPFVFWNGDNNKNKNKEIWYLVISLSADATKETKETNEDGSYIIIAMQIGSSTLSSGFGMYYCKLGICSC